RLLYWPARKPKAMSLLSGENAIFSARRLRGSSVRCRVPVAASQTQALARSEEEATSLPSGENVATRGSFEPSVMADFSKAFGTSSVCSSELQFSGTPCSTQIQAGHWSEKWFRTMLPFGAKIRAV